MTLKSLLSKVFVLISILVITDVAIADISIRVITVKGEYGGIVDGKILCLGDKGICYTIHTLESSQPAPTGIPPIMTATAVAILLDPDGESDSTATNEAIIDIANIVPLESIGPMEAYQVVTKPTTWYGTKTEALQWLYQQSLLYNPQTP